MHVYGWFLYAIPSKEEKWIIKSIFFRISSRKVLFLIKKLRKAPLTDEAAVSTGIGALIISRGAKPASTNRLVRAQQKLVIVWYKLDPYPSIARALKQSQELQKEPSILPLPKMHIANLNVDQPMN